MSDPADLYDYEAERADALAEWADRQRELAEENERYAADAYDDEHGEG